MESEDEFSDELLKLLKKHKLSGLKQRLIDIGCAITHDLSIDDIDDFIINDLEIKSKFKQNKLRNIIKEFQGNDVKVALIK